MPHAGMPTLGFAGGGEPLGSVRAATPYDRAATAAYTRDGKSRYNSRARLGTSRGRNNRGS